MRYMQGGARKVVAVALHLVSRALGGALRVLPNLYTQVVDHTTMDHGDDEHAPEMQEKADAGRASCYTIPGPSDGAGKLGNSRRKRPIALVPVKNVQLACQPED